MNRKQRRRLQSLGVPADLPTFETLEAIKQEYANECFRLGQFEYEMSVLETQLGEMSAKADGIRENIRRLNFAAKEMEDKMPKAPPAPEDNPPQSQDSTPTAPTEAA